MNYIPLNTNDHNEFLTILSNHLGQPIAPSLFITPEPETIAVAMPDLDNKTHWQTHVMEQNFILSIDPDPDIRAKALERLAKTSIVGLYETKVQVSINLLPPEELQLKVESLVNRINERVVG